MKLMNLFEYLYDISEKLKELVEATIGVSFASILASAHSEFVYVLLSLHNMIASFSFNVSATSSLLTFLQADDWKNLYDLLILVLLFLFALLFVSVGLKAPKSLSTFPIFTFLVYIFISPWKSRISSLINPILDLCFAKHMPVALSLMKRFEFPTVVFAASFVSIAKFLYSFCRYLLILIVVLYTWSTIAPSNANQEFTFYLFIIFATITIVAFVKMATLLERLALSILCSYVGSTLLVIYISIYDCSNGFSKFILETCSFTYNISNRVTLIFFFTLFMSFLKQFPYKRMKSVIVA